MTTKYIPPKGLNDFKRIPQEWEEHKAFMEWALLHPVVKKYIFKIDNEGQRKTLKRSLITGGIRKGVSDFFLPYPHNGKHGLWIEMKSRKGRPSPEQLEWIDKMRALDYVAELANSANKAIEITEKYLQ